MKKTWPILLCCLAACLAMGACKQINPPKEPNNILSPTQALFTGLDQLKPRVQTTQESSDPVNYRIVIDDGSGMQGFVSTYCMSYRAALGAVMDATASGSRTYIPASKLIGGASAESWKDSLLDETSDKAFFRDKSNNVCEVIETMADQYDASSKQVMILVSDLMMPTEDACSKVTNAIKDTFLKPENTTMGIIGIIGDFCGSIENLPVNSKSGYARKISEYMVLQRDEDGLFRHPIYILFFGDDQAVLSAMEASMTSLKSCGLLDETNPYHALFFSEYTPKVQEENNFRFEFNMGADAYNTADYNVKYVVRGIEDDSKDVQYSSSTVIPEQYQKLLKQIPIIKLYTDARGNEDRNVTIKCTVPYTLVDTATKGEQLIDKHGLLMPANEIPFAKEDYTVSIEVLEYNNKVLNDWVSPEQNLVTYQASDIKLSGENITASLSIKSSELKLDEPIFLLVRVRVQIDPKWEELESLYDNGWISDWSLNLKDFDREFNRQSTTPSSARFTYTTTAKTPFLKNLLYTGIADIQTGIVQKSISDQTQAIARVGMFGIVVRDYPANYLKEKHWSEDERFGGWAFSLKDVQEVLQHIDNDN